MSRHLKALTDEVGLRMRAKGTSRQYRLVQSEMAPEAKRLWQLLKEQVTALPEAENDAERLRGVLAERRSKSQEFFSSSAGEWDRMRSELVGRRLDLLGLLGLVDDRWVVGDLGCGTGQVSRAIAPFVRQVISIDDSPEMLSVARERLAGHPNVEVREGELEALPVEDMSLDAAVLFLVLHYLREPYAAFREVARVVKPGGRMLVVDLRPHTREEYRHEMGHLWMGFAGEQLENWAADSGMEGFNHVNLPADPETKGPPLFVATARMPRVEVWIPGLVD
jgi:ArsR family transcriptional regulator